MTLQAVNIESRRDVVRRMSWNMPLLNHGAEYRQQTNENLDGIHYIGAQLQSLMQAGDVMGARKLLAGVDAGEREDGRLARWIRALEPPNVRVGASGGTTTVERNAAWLRKHSGDYFGQWVALRDGELLGNHPNHVALHQELERRDELHGAVFVRIAEG